VRPRDRALERQLDKLAALAAGYGGDDGGLGAYADQRALPGGVRPDLDGIRELSEEIGDGRNYVVWDIERMWPLVLAGDAEACERYARLMAAHTRLVQAWRELHG
jgi:hypothetical protein